MFISRSNILCLIIGAAVGVGAFAILADSKPLKAAPQTDRTKKFAMTVCPADQLGQTNAIFTIDFLQGHVVGGVVNNQSGKFTHRYYRQLGQDFGVDPNTPEVEYAIVGTRADLVGNSMSKGIIFIGEKSSGKIIAYGFAYPNRAPQQPMTLTPLDYFQYAER